MSEEYYKKIFSENLKYYMNKLGKSQIDLVTEFGFDKSTVSTWFNGTRLPRMDKVDALAKYLGIKRSDLIEERVEEAPALVLSDMEIQVIEAYRRCTPELKTALHGFLGIKGGAEECETEEQSSVSQ